MLPSGRVETRSQSVMDIDQLGMLYPAPEGDQDRHQVKVAALAAVIANYRTFGSNVLVVSGVIDPARGADFARADFVDATIDTTGLAPTETAHALRRLLGPLEPMDGLGGPSAQGALALTLPHEPGNGDSVGMPCDVTVVCGPRAVGKSTVSWAMYMGQVAARTPTGWTTPAE